MLVVGYALDVLQFHPHDRCRNAVFLSKVSKTLLPLGDVNTHELHGADPLLKLGSVIVIILIWLVGGWLVRRLQYPCAACRGLH